MKSPARIRVRRRIEWIDTDAAGIYHWTTACRLAESAETELHAALGIERITFGATPRVSVNFEFKRSLRFNDPVEVEIAVAHVGRSSVRYAVTLVGPDGCAAEGTVAACFVDRDSGRPKPWPDSVREALVGGGRTTAVAA